MVNLSVYCFIIEDEPLAVEILDNYIRQTPFLETTWKTAFLDEAINMISNEKPDLLFLDLNTQGLNKDLINEVIRSRNSMRVILTTAYPKEHIAKMLQINMGGVGHLHKPFTYETFLKEVERIIGHT